MTDTLGSANFYVSPEDHFGEGSILTDQSDNSIVGSADGLQYGRVKISKFAR